jgi:hypothetical protein
LLTAKTLTVEWPPGTSATPNPITPERAWIMTSALWHGRRECSTIIKGAHPASQALTDLVHSLGTARVASLAAVLTTLWIAASISTFSTQSEHFWRFVGMLVIAALLIALFWNAYWRTGRLAQQLIDQVLADALVAEAAAERVKKVITHPLF